MNLKLKSFPLDGSFLPLAAPILTQVMEMKKHTP